MLAQAITLVESTHPTHRIQAAALLDALMPRTGRAIRLGITGVPGVGKSTFIDALGLHLIAQGLRVAVLAVDPTSARTGGSILGDKTRMVRLSQADAAFIRPSPTSGTLGGVASRTREALLLCEAAGFDVVLVETVGVGQSETAVAQMTDTFLALMLSGAGDQLQGIKRGLMEMADLLVVNKADGDNVLPATQAANRYRQALHLLTPAYPEWRPRVRTCSALTGTGVESVWIDVTTHREIMNKSGRLQDKRGTQNAAWMWTRVRESLELRFRSQNAERLATIEAQVRRGEIAPTRAAALLLGD
ncbi:MAG: LAO/AO transport system kinase [Bradymonadia bacterium]